jgi:hypothetical protein
VKQLCGALVAEEFVCVYDIDICFYATFLLELKISATIAERETLKVVCIKLNFCMRFEVLAAVNVMVMVF